MNKDNLMELWLQLINAETEEELEMLEQTGVMPIQKAVYVLHKMSEDERIQEAARLRERALLLESEMRRVERREGAESEREIWQGIVADIVADKDSQIADIVADKDSQIADKDSQIADKDSQIADKDSQIAELRAKLRGLS